MEHKSKRRNSTKGRKYPELFSVEYATITRNDVTILSIKGSDIEGKTFTEFQEYVGSRIPPGRFQFYIKFKNKNEPYTGNSRTLNFDLIESTKETPKELVELLQKIEQKINSKQDVGSSQLLEYQKSTFELRISDLKERNEELKSEIKRLEAEIDSYENDCDEYEDKIRELEGKSGTSQLIEKSLLFLQSKFGSGSTPNLAASDTSDIPKQILDVIGLVDFSKISQPDLDKITGGLRNYISLLPLKGQ